ncbi:Hypothetical predicted protein [Pelobates cultripes]|uniref:Transposase n=1 Tax=Pelobates cultripes TaxID=61616 RepID=A0AAD1WAU7_PELCU|nr:Hypothetical predicted protein [Pelobates cultripes]
MAAMLGHPLHQADPGIQDWVPRFKNRFDKLCPDFWIRIACNSHATTSLYWTHQRVERPSRDPNAGLTVGKRRSGPAEGPDPS